MERRSKKSIMKDSIDPGFASMDGNGLTQENNDISLPNSIKNLPQRLSEKAMDNI